MTILHLSPRVLTFDPPMSTHVDAAPWGLPDMPLALRTALAAAGWDRVSDTDSRVTQARQQWPSATVVVVARGARWRGFRVCADKRGRVSVAEF